MVAFVHTCLAHVPPSQRFLTRLAPPGIPPGWGVGKLTAAVSAG